MKIFFITAIWISSLSFASEKKQPPQDLKEVTKEEKDLPITQENALITRYGEIPTFNNMREYFSFSFPFLLSGSLHLSTIIIYVYFISEVASLRKVISNGLDLEISDSQKHTLERIDRNTGVLYIFLGFDYIMSLISGAIHYVTSLDLLPICPEFSQHYRQQQLSKLISKSQMSDLFKTISFMMSGAILTSLYGDYSIPKEIEEDFNSARGDITPFFITAAFITITTGCTAVYIKCRGRGAGVMEKVKGWFSWRSTRRRMSEMAEIPEVINP